MHVPTMVLNAGFWVSLIVWCSDQKNSLSYIIMWAFFSLYLVHQLHLYCYALEGAGVPWSTLLSKRQSYEWLVKYVSQDIPEAQACIQFNLEAYHVRRRALQLKKEEQGFEKECDPHLRYEDSVRTGPGHPSEGRFRARQGAW